MICKTLDEMKKLIIIFAATVAALSLSFCSKEESTSNSTEGEYTLKTVSASLGATSKTSLDAAYKVDWSDNDIIAIINTSTNKIYEYKLSSGAGTGSGTFVPVSTEATYTDISQLRAAYPASAASVKSGTISMTVNSEQTPTSFSVNDVRISNNTPSGTTPNFTFTSLATWCMFTLDFTSNTDYKAESLENVKVEYVDNGELSGTAAVKGTTSPTLTLGNYSKFNVTWTPTSPVSLASAVNVGIMIIPPTANTEKKLLITAKTTYHIFTFYATPKNNLAAGQAKAFSIKVDNGFSVATSGGTNGTYIVSKRAQFYYGTTNCVLIKKGETSATIDITPYRTSNDYARPTSGDLAGYGAPIPTKAVVYWCESGLSITAVFNNTSVTVNRDPDSGGYGNALVAIEDASNKVLWSYHIWCPEDDPTATLTYNSLPSGTYEVMPMALGATKIATYESSDADKASSYGLYYQWGRKDPLGRPSDITSSSLLTVTGTAFSTVERGSAGSYNAEIIAYSISNPTTFIYYNYLNYNWTLFLDNDLWGNPKGYNFPTMSNTVKTIYDPCPTGYRVAPKDLWTNCASASNHDYRHGDKLTYNTSDKTKVDFYPASGYRSEFDGGALTDVGSNSADGSYWSSSPFAENYMTAGTSRIYSEPHSNGASYRSEGLPVRCVKE